MSSDWSFDKELEASLVFEYAAPHNKHKSIYGEVQRLMALHTMLVNKAERAYFDSVLKRKAKDSPDMTIKEWADRLYAKQTWRAAELAPDPPQQEGSTT